MAGLRLALTWKWFLDKPVTVQILIGVATTLIGGALATVGSLAASSALWNTELWLNTESRHYRVDLGNKVTRVEFDNASHKMANFQCLIVRYGANDYLTGMASPEERSFGYTQLKKVPMAIDFEMNGDAVLDFEIPLHKRLGTQFKCFIDFPGTESDKDNMTSVIQRFDNIQEFSWTVPSPGINRGWFVLSAPGFGCVTETRDTFCVNDTRKNLQRWIDEAGKLGVHVHFTPPMFSPIENNYVRAQ
jgi:hypothetical protein